MKTRRLFLQKLGLGFGFAIACKSKPIQGELISYTRFQNKWIRFNNSQIDSFVGAGEVLDNVGLNGLKKMIDQDELHKKQRTLEALEDFIPYERNVIEAA